MDSIKTHFESPSDQSQVLFNKALSLLVYTSPLNKTAYWKAIGLDTVFYGTSLLVIYTLASRYLCKMLPPLPSRTWTVIKVLSPLFLYRLAQILVGLVVHPASLPFFCLFSGRNASFTSLEFKRSTIVSSYQKIRFSAVTSTKHQVDAMFLKREGGELSGPCLLISNGNVMFYEETFTGSWITDLANKLGANILMYNYPGTGRSSGLFPNGEAMAASHEAMCGVLQQLGASHIYDFGWSVGGGVKWRDHLESPKEGNVTVIDYQTFRSTSRFGKEIFGRIGELAVKFLGWEYPSEEASKSFRGKHIIVQDGNPQTEEVLNDGMMFVENALATEAPDSATVILMNTRKIYSETAFVSFRTLGPTDIVHGLPIDLGTVNQIVAKIREG